MIQRLHITGLHATAFIDAAVAMLRLYGADVEVLADGLLIAHRDYAAQQRIARQLVVLADDAGVTLEAAA